MPNMYKALQEWIEAHASMIALMYPNMKVLFVVTSLKNDSFVVVLDEKEIDAITEYTGSNDCLWFARLDNLLRTYVPLISISADGTCHYWQK